MRSEWGMLLTQHPSSRTHSRLPTPTQIIYGVVAPWQNTLDKSKAQERPWLYIRDVSGGAPVVIGSGLCDSRSSSEDAEEENM